MYHNIAEQGGFNTLSLRDFEEHLKFLSSSQKYKVVSLDDYLKFEQKKQISVTFDDAYVCLKDKVLSLIEKYQIPISIFVPVAHVGLNNSWDMKNGNEKSISIMDWEDIRFLNNHPLITIGSHGCQHVSIGMTGEGCYEEEYAVSKKILESQIGHEVDYFAYPYGQYKDVPQDTSAVFFQKWGYKAYLTTNWSRKNSIKNKYKLNRLEILDNYDVDYLQKILNRTFDKRYYKQKLKNFLYGLKLIK